MKMSSSMEIDFPQPLIRMPPFEGNYFFKQKVFYLKNNLFMFVALTNIRTG